MSGVFDLESKRMPRPAAMRSVPVGSLLPYGGSAAPDGFLLCDGQAVSRTVYADLFDAISTTYGVGDGSTTFNLPDLRSRVPMGAGDGGAALTNRVLGEKVGAETVTLTTTQIPSHNHTTPNHSHDISHQHTWGQRTTGAGADTTGTGVPPHNATPTGGAISTANLSTSTSANASPTTNLTGGGGAHDNVQPSLVLNFIICAAWA